MSTEFLASKPLEVKCYIECQMRGTKRSMALHIEKGNKREEQRQSNSVHLGECGCRRGGREQSGVKGARRPEAKGI